MRAKLRFKRHWEDIVKQANDIEVVFGKALGEVWSRDHDGKAFGELARFLGMERQHVILDIGCGALARAEVQFGLQGFRVIGVDISRTAVHHAQTYVKKEGVLEKTDFAVVDAEFLPFRSDNFDVTVCIGTICHLPSKNSVVKALSEIKRVTKSNGKIYIPWWLNCFSILGIEHALFLPLFDLLHIPHAQFLRFKGLSDIKNILGTAGLLIQKIRYGNLLSLTWIPNFIPKTLRAIIYRLMQTINRFHEKNKTFTKFSTTFEITCQNGKPDNSAKPESYHVFL